MKIEVKDINYTPELFENKITFSGILFIEGEEIGQCSNQNTNGIITYKHKGKDSGILIKKADEYWNSQPLTFIKYMIGPNEDLYLKRSVETQINEIVYHMTPKEEMHIRHSNSVYGLRELELNHIIWGHRGLDIYARKFASPIVDIINHPNKIQPFIRFINYWIMPRLNDGRILNKNIPEIIFQAAGIKPDQYNKSDSELKQTLTKKIRKGL